MNGLLYISFVGQLINTAFIFSNFITQIKSSENGAGITLESSNRTTIRYASENSKEVREQIEFSVYVKMFI